MGVEGLEGVVDGFGSGVVGGEFGEVSADEVEGGFEDVLAEGFRGLGGEGEDVCCGWVLARAGDPDGDGDGCVVGLDGTADVDLVSEGDDAGGGDAEQSGNFLKDGRKLVFQSGAGADVDGDRQVFFGVAVPWSQSGADAGDVGNGGLDVFRFGL